MDALKKIKAGTAASFEGEHAGTAFRVMEPRPFDNMLVGYVYTQNSNEAQHPLQETMYTGECRNVSFIRTADDTADDDDKSFRLDLDPGTSDLILLVRMSEPMVLRIAHRTDLR